MRDGPWVVLTRHFLASMFDFGILLDAGVDSFKRLMLGSLAVAIGLGLLLVRMFMGKYAGLPPESYLDALAADHAFLMAIPMWVVASAVVLTGHSLFPDETDYRILMAEPLPRHVIFTAKLTALLLFGGIVVGGTHAALLPLLLLTMGGQPGVGAMAAATASFVVSSGAASLCSALAIVAIHGVLVLFVPRSRRLALEAVTRGALIATLVLSLPLLARLPATAQAFAANAWWLRLVPPAWFVGLERALLGTGGWQPLAMEAIAALLVTLTAAVGSYVVLYRRFDRVALRPSALHAPILPVRWRAHWQRRRHARVAIGEFISITLRRSVLHQGIIVGVLAAAAALAGNAVLASGLPSAAAAARPDRSLGWVTLWAPATLIFILVPAVRLGLSVPMDLRANWVFRMTDDDGARADAVGAGVRAVFVLGVVWPVMLVAPLQWMLVGPPTLQLVAVELTIGWLLVEFLMRGWMRIPFTCTYLPGKGFAPHMFARGLAGYVVFTTLVQGVLLKSARSMTAAFIVVTAVGTVAGVLSFRRARHARVTPLTFEDEPPMDVIRLPLNGD